MDKLIAILDALISGLWFWFIFVCLVFLLCVVGEFGLKKLHQLFVYIVRKVSGYPSQVQD